jgi:hypothetical protein
MNELRAPDPTLTAISHRLVTVVDDDGILEAHDADCAHAWGPRLMARYVAWQAVPCRECFPDAPPPGSREMFYKNGKLAETWPDRDLEWQVRA